MCWISVAPPLLRYTALSAESDFNFAPVPEPSHLLLVTSGLLVVLCRRTRCLRLRRPDAEPNSPRAPALRSGARCPAAAR
jgi:hypothetical protein